MEISWRSLARYLASRRGGINEPVGDSFLPNVVVEAGDALGGRAVGLEDRRGEGHARFDGEGREVVHLVVDHLDHGAARLGVLGLELRDGAGVASADVEQAADVREVLDPVWADAGAVASGAQLDLRVAS